MEKIYSRLHFEMICNIQYQLFLIRRKIIIFGKTKNPEQLISKKISIKYYSVKFITLFFYFSFGFAYAKDNKHQIIKKNTDEKIEMIGKKYFIETRRILSLLLEIYKDSQLKNYDKSLLLSSRTQMLLYKERGEDGRSVECTDQSENFPQERNNNVFPSLLVLYDKKYTESQNSTAYIKKDDSEKKLQAIQLEKLSKPSARRVESYGEPNNSYDDIKDKASISKAMLLYSNLPNNTKSLDKLKSNPVIKNIDIKDKSNRKDVETILLVSTIIIVLLAISGWLSWENNKEIRQKYEYIIRNFESADDEHNDEILTENHLQLKKTL